MSDATLQSLPKVIYVWLVRSEEVQDQPGSWRIRKWDTEPFPEANFSISSAEAVASAGWTPCAKCVAGEACRDGLPCAFGRQDNTKKRISEEMIDRALLARIPGGSSAEDWFLPHEKPKAVQNIRDVVKAMLEAARVAPSTERECSARFVESPKAGTVKECPECGTIMGKDAPCQRAPSSIERATAALHACEGLDTADLSGNRKGWLAEIVNDAAKVESELAIVTADRDQLLVHQANLVGKIAGLEERLSPASASGATATELDLAMAVRRLAARLNLRSNREADKVMVAAMLDLLKRKGLDGSPIRDEPSSIERATPLIAWCEDMAKWCEQENTPENDRQFTEADRENWLECARLLRGFHSSIEAISQGPCETTLTPRFQISDCACGTYDGNLGPCLTWWQGAKADRCVYCDHGLDCHVKLSKLLASDKPQGDPKNANLAALVLKLDKHISLHEMLAPEWEAIVAEARKPQSATREFSVPPGITVTMNYKTNYGETLEHHAPLWIEARVSRLDQLGLGFIENTATAGRYYPFTFDRIDHYRGEKPKEIGLREGGIVHALIKDGKVERISLKGIPHASDSDVKIK